MLEQGLDSTENQERQGVCIGLSEIIQQTSRDNVLLYVDSLLPTIRNALCDKEPDVRAAAAQTFDSLHSTVGEYVNELSLFNSVHSYIHLVSILAVYLSIFLYILLVYLLYILLVYLLYISVYLGIFAVYLWITDAQCTTVLTS